MKNFPGLRKSAGKKLAGLLEEYDHKCAFCGCELVHVANILEPHRIRQTGHHLHYLDNGQLVVKMFATVEHIVPLAGGGSNAWSNLRPACGRCNQDHSRQLPANGVKRDRRICRKCGGPKENRKNRKCNQCRMGWMGPGGFGTNLGKMLKEAGITVESE